MAPIIFDSFQRISANDDSLMGVILYPSQKVKTHLETLLKSYPSLIDKVGLNEE
jgi:hypothetical protein